MAVASSAQTTITTTIIITIMVQVDITTMKPNFSWKLKNFLVLLTWNKPRTLMLFVLISAQPNKTTISLVNLLVLHQNLPKNSLEDMNLKKHPPALLSSRELTDLAINPHQENPLSMVKEMLIPNLSLEIKDSIPDFVIQAHTFLLEKPILKTLMLEIELSLGMVITLKSKKEFVLTLILMLMFPINLLLMSPVCMIQLESMFS